MDFLQGQSIETTVAVAVVAIAAGGAFLLLRSRKPKGMDMYTPYYSSCVDARCLCFV
jgi:hypothetical protein